MRKSCKKSIGYLEDATEAVSACYGLDLTYQEHLDYFNFVIDNFEECKRVYGEKSELIDQYKIGAYCGQDLRSLKNAPAIIHKYCDMLVTQRDKLMAKNMKYFLHEGEAFFAIGAAHLPGVTKLLSEDGFLVEEVILSQKQYHITEIVNHSNCGL